MKNQDIFRGYILLEDKFQVRSSAEWTEKGGKSKEDTETRFAGFDGIN